MKEVNVSNMNGGEGSVSAKMYVNESGKVIVSRIHSGSSIGMHIQKTSNDINFVVSGVGKAICDGFTENLVPWRLPLLQERFGAFDNKYW